jgi:peptidoglycan hydrolase-like protein with peptidoglycan-binding domain
MIDPNDANMGDTDHAALPQGRRVGRYEILSILGQGGFGITYRARDTELGRDVAIKEYLPAALAVRHDGITVLPRSTKMAEDFAWGRDRFVAEGRTLASLHHAPAIVRVFDFLQANGTAYIVMELLSGDTLGARIARNGKLSPPEVDRILWPLLDGLEQVHNAGFLHRDIKPANILLDAAGKPTLIDFGASRAAMAGRSTALTAIFTPGYAAAEQMTSAKQGPWTDIYGLSATLYHAIIGAPPPSTFDRMLDDGYEPMGRMAPPGFGRGLLAGIDAGLAVRAIDRPQSIAGWRPILQQAGSPAAVETVAMPRAPTVQPVAPPPPAVVPPAPARKAGVGRLAGGAVAAILALAGGYYALDDGKRPTQTPAPAVATADRAAQDAQLEAEAQRLRDQEELARLRAENERRLRAEQEAALRKQVEEETRRRIEAETAAKKQEEAAAAEKKRQEDEARHKAEAETAAQRQTDEANQRVAEAGELGLRLTANDRRRIQVALTALGFDTRGADGVFGALTREMIAAWQKARGLAPTGFVTGEQNQALLKEAAAALSRFDDERRKVNRTAGDETGRASVPPPSVAAPAPVAPPAAPRPPPSPVTSPSQAIIVQSEPPTGSLRHGQVILVDDGTCPAGQIKEVTGGRSNERVQRTRRCIPRPRN